MAGYAENIRETKNAEAVENNMPVASASDVYD